MNLCRGTPCDANIFDTVLLVFMDLMCVDVCAVSVSDLGGMYRMKDTLESCYSLNRTWKLSS